MKIKSISLERMSQERTLRADFVYNHHFSDLDRGKEYVSFDELFSVVKRKFDIQELDGSFKYCQISDVDKNGEIHPVTLNFDERNLLDESYYKKIESGDIIEVCEHDILVSFLLPQDVSVLGKMLRVTPDIADVFFTSAFLCITPKIMPEILYYALKSVFYKDLVAISRIRKGYTGYATLDSSDLRQLKFDKRTIEILRGNYEELKGRIKAREDGIAEASASLESAESIINRIFQKEFGFDYASFQCLKAIKTYTCAAERIANNPDLRFSAKFHRGAGRFVMEQLTGVTSKKIKHFLSEPIVLGAGISPKDYLEDSGYYYISMAAIKSWAFDSEGASTVSKEFFDAKREKTVRKNDIIFVRSGEGTIGKAALIDSDDIQGVFCDFTMRIRLKDYNPEFAYYYFRTGYFQYLVEIYKKGLGNNTNIFPIAMKEFPMIDIPLGEQQRIVDEIRGELEKQNKIRARIAELRADIDALVRETVESGGVRRTACPENT